MRTVGVIGGRCCPLLYQQPLIREKKSLLDVAREDRSVPVISEFRLSLPQIGVLSLLIFWGMICCRTVFGVSGCRSLGPARAAPTWSSAQPRPASEGWAPPSQPQLGAGLEGCFCQAAGDESSTLVPERPRLMPFGRWADAPRCPWKEQRRAGGSGGGTGGAGLHRMVPLPSLGQSRGRAGGDPERWGTGTQEKGCRF